MLEVIGSHLTEDMVGCQVAENASYNSGERVSRRTIDLCIPSFFASALVRLAMSSTCIPYERVKIAHKGKEKWLRTLGPADLRISAT